MAYVPSRLIRQPEASFVTGLSKSMMYLLIARGDFPKPRKISKRAVAWSLEEIEAWASSRKIAA